MSVQVEKDRPKENSNSIQKRNSIRAGSLVRELIIQNDLKYHWVLTFNDDNLHFGTDRMLAVKDFNRFTKELRDNIGEYRYLAVLEVQQARLKLKGVRCWHFHMVLDRFIDHSVMANAWGRGYVFVSEHPDTRKGLFEVAGYLSKYVKKDMLEYHQFNHKRYLCSQGLERAGRLKVKFSDDEMDILRRCSLVNLKFVDGDVVEWLQLRDDDLLRFISDYNDKDKA